MNRRSISEKFPFVALTGFLAIAFVAGGCDSQDNKYDSEMGMAVASGEFSRARRQIETWNEALQIWTKITDRTSAADAREKLDGIWDRAVNADWTKRARNPDGFGDGPPLDSELRDHVMTKMKSEIDVTRDLITQAKRHHEQLKTSVTESDEYKSAETVLKDIINMEQSGLIYGINY